jgi:hypothetical protein
MGCLSRKYSSARWSSYAMQLLLCVALVAIGCRKQGIERAIVYGTVSFAGKPMPTGTIHFTPIEGTKTPPGAAQVVDGKYRVESRGGVPVGTHKIEIEAFRPLSPDSPVAIEAARIAKEHPNLDFPPTREQYVPARYNTASELTISIPAGSKVVEHNLELTE